MARQFGLTASAWAGAALLLLAGSLAVWNFLVLTPSAAPTKPPGTAADGGQEDPTAAIPLAIRSAALTATLRVVNETTGAEGSGVLVKRQGRFAYVLTADHVADGGARFAFSYYPITTYPPPADADRSATVLARSAAA